MIIWKFELFQKSCFPLVSQNVCFLRQNSHIKANKKLYTAPFVQFSAVHRVLSTTKLIFKFQKYRKFFYLHVNVLTFLFFVKMRFLSKFASKTLKIVFLKFFKPSKSFLSIFKLYICLNKPKFCLSQILINQNRFYNFKIACSGTTWFFYWRFNQIKIHWAFFFIQIFGPMYFSMYPPDRIFLKMCKLKNLEPLVEKK